MMARCAMHCVPGDTRGRHQLAARSGDSLTREPLFAVRFVANDEDDRVLGTVCIRLLDPALRARASVAASACF